MNWFKKKPKQISTNQSHDPQIDINSDTWAAVAKAVEAEKSILMVENCSLKLSDRKTCLIRGQIKQCEWVLSLPGRD